MNELEVLVLIEQQLQTLIDRSYLTELQFQSLFKFLKTWFIIWLIFRVWGLQRK